MLGVVLLAITLPLVWTERPEEPDEYGSFWGALGALVLRGDDAFGARDDPPPGLTAGLVLATVGIVLLGACLVAVALLAGDLIFDGDAPGRPHWQHVTLGWLLTIAVVLLAGGAAQIPDPDETEGLYRGLGAGAGLWAPLLLAAVVGTTPENRPWSARR